MLTLPRYQPSPRVYQQLLQEKHISISDGPQQMLERVVEAIFGVEKNLKVEEKDTKLAAEEFAQYFVDGYLMLGGPTLYNAGRGEKALTSCVLIPVNLNEKLVARERIISYFKQNMGSGFNLSDYSDPVGLLHWLNDLCIKESKTGKYDRIIGNLGMCDISHPRIREFIDAKNDPGILKHFNLSINITESFMQNVENGEKFTLSNGNSVSASSLFDQIVENAWINGEPGIVFLERMNRDNPIFEFSPYSGVPPCSEMGLAPGETCQFGYINLSKFLSCELPIEIDYPKLEKVTRLLTRTLDDAIEYSLEFFPTDESKRITGMKRKIGIGVCGLADLLILCNTPYDSSEARLLARDIISFINFISKMESVELAKKRGSCLSMNYMIGNRYITGEFLEEKYGAHPTGTVSKKDWFRLGESIRETHLLRNILTTTLPPATIASFLETTPSIEPIFNIFVDESIKKIILNYLKRELKDTETVRTIIKQAQEDGSFQKIEILPPLLKENLKTAKEISINGHLQMVSDLAGLEGVIDEAASKTVNLANSASKEDVRNIFYLAYQMRIKNIAVYRDGSRKYQPEKL